MGVYGEVVGAAGGVQLAVRGELYMGSCLRGGAWSCTWVCRSPPIPSQTLGPTLLGTVLRQDPAPGRWCEPGVHRGGCVGATCSQGTWGVQLYMCVCSPDP